MNPLTVRIMHEIGITLDGQTSKSLREYLGKQLFAYLITVCADAEQQCPTVWPGVQHRQHWNFEDPATYAGAEDEKLEKFREIRDQIGVAINAFIESERMQHGANRTP